MATTEARITPTTAIRKTRRGRRKKRKDKKAKGNCNGESGPETPNTDEVSTVINLSPIELTPCQIQVLSRGLSFAPTYHANHFDTKIDLFRFYRNLHLKAWYAQRPNIQDTQDHSVETLSSTTKFKPKSTFFPLSTNPSLLAFTKKVDYDVQRLFATPNPTPRKNLTIPEQQALRDLQQNKEIVIKKADKGGATVVWHYDKYLREAQRQLHNTEYYTELSSNPLPTMQKELNTLLTRAKLAGWITEKEYAFMHNEHAVISTFYMLPKVHKAPRDSPPGRPIVAANGSMTEPASQFIDHYLKPYVHKLPSYVRDTTDVLNKINNLSDTTWNYLVTMDVESLYTNIDHTEGLRAVNHYLSEREEMTPPSSFLTELTSWVLHNNVFLFQDVMYRQRKGTSMGASFAPEYACLFLGLWESEYVFNAEKNRFKDNIKLYCRFIDDILILFKGTEMDLREMHNYLNNTNKNIKLTLEHSENEINFLDLTVYRKDHQLHTTLYRKPTDRNTILHYQSYHPQHLKDNIPYGQFQRLKRICDQDEDFCEQSDRMSKRFHERSYKRSVVSAARTKAASTNRSSLLQPSTKRKKRKNTGVCFVTRYSTHAPEIRRIIRSNWDILKSDPTLHDTFKDFPMFCYRRAPSLKDRLTRSYLPARKKEHWLKKPIGTFKCLQSTCNHCGNIKQHKDFTDFKTNEKHKIKHFVNCNTTYVVYRLICPCNHFYVGRTKRRLKDRVAEHKYAIRCNNEDYPMARHFNSAHNGDASLLQVEALEHVQTPPRGGDRLKLLLQRETYWIHKLDAMRPPGLNEEIDFRPFL